MPNDAQKIIVYVASILASIVLLAILSLTIPDEGSGRLLATFLLDRHSDFFPYPLTIQNLMWVMFAMGCGELFIRYRSGTREYSQVAKGFLPQDDSIMLRSADLGDIYKSANFDQSSRDCFLPRLISRTILQFQSSRSVDQANSLLNSSLELYQHEVDINYSMIRYITWLIPTLGFIGTVIGIALALNDAGVGLSNDPQNSEILQKVTESLGVAFYTTLLALLLSAVLVFFLHVAQAREEKALNYSGQYCLDHLINRLYER